MRNSLVLRLQIVTFVEFPEQFIRNLNFRMLFYTITSDVFRIFFSLFLSHNLPFRGEYTATILFTNGGLPKQSLSSTYWLATLNTGAKGRCVVWWCIEKCCSTEYCFESRNEVSYFSCVNIFSDFQRSLWSCKWVFLSKKKSLSIEVKLSLRNLH